MNNKYGYSYYQTNILPFFKVSGENISWNHIQTTSADPQSDIYQAVSFSNAQGEWQLLKTAHYVDPLIVARKLFARDYSAKRFIKPNEPLDKDHLLTYYMNEGSAYYALLHSVTRDEIQEQKRKQEENFARWEAEDKASEEQFQELDS